jgi:putative pyruvate formate lyase activating enzyme
MKLEPSYLKLCESGELDGRIEKLYKILESYELCPRRCRVNRLEGKKGHCRSSREPVVSSYFPWTSTCQILSIAKVNLRRNTPMQQINF